GFVRTTEDVDILIESSSENVTRLLNELGNFGEGHARELRPADFSDTEGAIRIIEDFPLDVFTIMRSKRYADLVGATKSARIDEVKLLGESFADRNDHAPAVFQLIDQRLRNLVRRAGHNNGVEWRLFRPALVAVTHLQMHVFVTETLQRRFRSFRQRLDDFDRV